MNNWAWLWPIVSKTLSRRGRGNEIGLVILFSFLKSVTKTKFTRSHFDKQTWRVPFTVGFLYDIIFQKIFNLSVHFRMIWRSGSVKLHFDRFLIWICLICACRCYTVLIQKQKCIYSCAEIVLVVAFVVLWGLNCGDQR